MVGERLRCLVTGANGYVGSAITNYLSKQGRIVYRLEHLTKRPPSPHNEFIIPYVLEAEIDEMIFDNMDALIHCAYDFRWSKWKDIKRVNVEGSLRLLEYARKSGVRNIVYISSISAYEGCRSLYGKAKLMIEERALEMGAMVIRPGLVYGSNTGGMIGALGKAVSSNRVLPLVGRGDHELYLVHEGDLCRLVNRCIVGNIVFSSTIIAANVRVVTLKNILQALAVCYGKKLIFIPIPWWLIWFGLRGGELIGLNLGFRSDSLVSLVNQNLTPDFSETRRSGVEFRVFNFLLPPSSN